MIYFTSDPHFGHDRAFIYGPRGFGNIQEHDNTIIENWNKVVKPEDTVYLLGDVALKDNDNALKCVNSLNGNIMLIRGNHDTQIRWDMYSDKTLCPNITILGYADLLNYKGYHLYMSHFPTMTGNLEKESLKKCTCNLFGHTHQKAKFYNDLPYLFHVGVDSNNCTPISIDEVIENMKQEANKCISYL